MKDYLVSNSLFSDLEEADFGALKEATAKKVYPKNTIILSEGDRTDSLYLVCAGKVKVSIIDENGKEIILAMLGPGEYFGEMTALADGKNRSACVTTRETTELLVIERDDFRKLIQDKPDIVFSMLLKSMERLREADKKIESLALMDVYGRVARLLTNMAGDVDGRQVINEKLTHQDIANMVGSSREMVSRVMKELTDGNYITVDKKIIQINGKLPYSW